MNILLIDNDEKINGIVQEISKIRNYNFFKSDFTFDQYFEKDIDLVIVDFSDEEAMNLLNQIISFNPRESIITISEKLECAEFMNCEKCKRMYNKKRLIKPIDINQLVQTIDNFDTISCRYENIDCFSDFNYIIDDVMRRFDYFVFDKNENKIYADKEANENQLTFELLNLTQLLNDFKVEFALVDNKEIQLKS